MVDTRIHLKFLAVFLIFLTILIPIEFSLLVNAYTPTWGPGASHSSSSSGQHISIRNIQGVDGISNFRRRHDTITITAQASFGPNTTVSPNNLVVYFSGNALGTFQQCSLVDPSASMYECTFRERNDTGPASLSVQTYEVRLINGTDVLSTTSHVTTVDGTAPSVIYLNPSSTLTSSQNITVNFQVKDYAFGSTGGVGLRSVSLNVNGQPQYTFPEGSSSSDSDGVYDPVTAIDLLTRTNIPVSLGTNSGTYVLSLRAEDYFGQIRSSNVTVVVDRDAPSILSHTFKVNDENGNPALWLNDVERTFTAYLEFQADDLDVSSIYGDFSDSHIYGLNNRVVPICSPLQNHTYGCTFTFRALINESGSYLFSFYVKDTLNNLANAHLTHNYNYDITGPVATLLETSKYYNGNYFIGKDPLNITVRFTEQGIGMNDSKAYLDLSGIGMGGSVQAFNCTPSWSCVWTEVSASESTVSGQENLVLTTTVNGSEVSHEVNARLIKVDVLHSTQDNLGNLANKTTFNLSSDIYKPEIVDYNITPISADASYEGVTVVGDYIYILFNLTDATFITLNVSADDFVNTAGGFSDSVICLDNYDGTHVCEYIFGPISREGYYEGELKLIFTDYLDNSITHTKKIEVLEILNETPNYWSLSADTCSPSPLLYHELS
jgi:hypothetical protein